MTVALIFPPVVDPRAPHLALPSLAAYLRCRGVAVEMFDLNAHGMRYLLQPERLRRSAATLRRALRGEWSITTPEARLALYANKVVDSIEGALATLGDPQRFFDAHAFNSARQLVVAGLAIAAAARSPRLSCAIMPPGYEIEGIDPQRLADLIEVSARDDLNLFSEHWQEELFPALARLQPELVGITITNRQQVIPGLMLARALRRQGYFTVLGGTVFTKFANELASLPEFFAHFADAVNVYEGETALLALLEELRGGRRLAHVPNLLYTLNGRVHATATHVEDINALPTPDFAGLDLRAYLAPHPVLPILTGKGCYFNRCKFCDIPYINHVSRKAYRVRHEDRIAADVNTLADRFDCRHFVITDEALSPRLLVKLAAALEPSRHRNFSFTGYARLEAGFTPEVCRTLRDMGMRKLYFGLESADQATLDHMDKGTRADLAPQLLHNCAEAGINFHIFSIIGFPQEPETSAHTTCNFFLANRDIIDHPGNSFDIHPFGLELRTDYFDDRDRFDIRVDPGALDKDFVIGIERTQWDSPSAMDSATLKHLLEDEFYPKLREIYRRHHATAEPIWPGFEEYAALYCDHYAGREFPFYTSMPATAAGEQIELHWNPALAVMEKDEDVLLLQRSSFVLLARRLYTALHGRRLAAAADGPPDPALMQALGDPQRLQSYLDWLVSCGYLQLRVVRNVAVDARQGT